jgi:aminoglycoside 6-adenylyltransferase
MRTEKEMFRLILETAERDERIRAVILNGSRANPNAQKDNFQDYDVVYFVDRIETFTADHGWIDRFGERVILQLPDLMRLPSYAENDKSVFAYLMLFTDRNRIDLTLFPVEKIETEFAADSLSVLLLDKDDLFPALPPPDESDYLIRPPSEQEFLDVCNEFWWVMPYVAKGLARAQIAYAKDIFETIVRKMFMKIVEWRIGTETDFSVNFGASGKHLKQLVEPELYEMILLTYPDAGIGNIWDAVFLTADLFDESARIVAGRLEFAYNEAESRNVGKYLKAVKALSQNP